MNKKLFAFIVLLMSRVCFGHAHIFIDYKIHACFDNNGLEGVYVNWTFDQMFTSFIKKEFDLDHNGELSQEEQQNIYAKAFGLLKKDNYFAVIKINGSKVPIPEPQQFSARLIKDKDMVAYTFFFPLSIKSDTKKQELEIYFFDPVIYVAYIIMKNDITMQNKSNSIDATISLKTINYVNRPLITFQER